MYEIVMKSCEGPSADDATFVLKIILILAVRLTLMILLSVRWLYISLDSTNDSLSVHFVFFRSQQRITR